MASTEKLETHQAALVINLEPTSYGPVAAVGAGQKVVRYLIVSVSGTVANSISAFEKEVSDDLYGSSSAISGRDFDVTHLPIAAPARTTPVNREAI